MKAVESQGSESRTTVTLDLELPDNLSQAAKKRIQDDVGQYIVEQVLLSVSKAQSPVSGEDWPALSKDYKAKKVAEGGSGKPDMELMGDMLNALTYKGAEEGLEVGFFGKEAWKADGHLKFSGEENHTPQRRFLPEEGQEFKRDIQREAEKIVAEAIVDETKIPRSQLKDIESSGELYSLLKYYLGDLSRSELRMAVLASDTLSELLADMDLLELL